MLYSNKQIYKGPVLCKLGAVAEKRDCLPYVYIHGHVPKL